MYYDGWDRQRPFWDYQELSKEQYYMWVIQLPKYQGRDCETTQHLTCA